MDDPQTYEPAPRSQPAQDPSKRGSFEEEAVEPGEAPRPHQTTPDETDPPRVKRTGGNQPI